jgi:hypothetical protein
MKSALVTLLSLSVLPTVFSFTVGLVPSAAISSISQFQNTKLLRSTPTDRSEDDEEGLDLNLEEMFTMFDAADKGVDFDKAIDKVKGEK